MQREGSRSPNEGVVISSNCPMQVAEIKKICRRFGKRRGTAVGFAELPCTLRKRDTPHVPHNAGTPNKDQQGCPPRERFPRVGACGQRRAARPLLGTCTRSAGLCMTRQSCHGFAEPSLVKLCGSLSPARSHSAWHHADIRSAKVASRRVRAFRAEGAARSRQPRRPLGRNKRHYEAAASRACTNVFAPVSNSTSILPSDKRRVTTPKRKLGWSMTSPISKVIAGL